MNGSCMKDGRIDYQCLRDKSRLNHPDTNDSGYKHDLDEVALKRRSDSDEGQPLRWQEFFGKIITYFCFMITFLFVAIFDHIDDPLIDLVKYLQLIY